MIIYCSFEPGLFILEGLAPHETERAFAVIKSLFLHKDMMDRSGAQIPMTNQYLDRIYSAFDNIPINNPPIKATLKEYVIAALAKMSKTPLTPAGVANTIIDPDISSYWISEDIRRVWLDSLSAALIEKITKNNLVLSSATWERKDIPGTINLICPEICEIFEIAECYWELPVLANKYDWEEFLCQLRGWPIGLESTLIECYARRILGIHDDQLHLRRQVRFEPSCQREIVRQGDPDIRRAIIDVIACLAYNRLRPEHHDEKIKSQAGMRRVSVKKMNPPVRFHYYLDGGIIIFSMFSHGDHDRGLS